MKRWKLVDGIVKKLTVARPRSRPHWEGNQKPPALTLLEMAVARKHEGHSQRRTAELCQVSVGKLQRSLKSAGREWANL